MWASASALKTAGPAAALGLSGPVGALQGGNSPSSQPRAPVFVPTCSRGLLLQGNACMRARLSTPSLASERPSASACVFSASAWGAVQPHVGTSLLRDLFRSVNGAMERHPVAAAVLICAAKSGAADCLCQVALEGKGELDRRRSLVFLTFGGAYQGGFQYFLWNVIFERIWPGSCMRACLAKLVATNLVSDPVFFFPTFYILKEALAGEQSSAWGVVSTALGRYRENCFTDWMAGWMIWIPGHYVTYFLLPVHMRVPWVAAASFVYICILSYLRGDTPICDEVAETRKVVEAYH